MSKFITILKFKSFKDYYTMKNIENLIEMVREKPYLYDKSNPDYKNVLLKEKTWKEISKDLNIDESKCKLKWKGLRDSYYREIKRKNLPSGSGAVGVSKWKYFDNMQFLQKVSQVRNDNFQITDVDEEFDIDEFNEFKSFKDYYTMENIENLIEMVREKPYLYDKSSQGYKNVLLKEKTWKKISKALNIDESKCKLKWKGLRDSYYREIKRKNLSSGSGAVGVSKWKYFDNMQFLQMVPQVRNSDNFQITDVEEEFDIDDEFDEPFLPLSPNIVLSETPKRQQSNADKTDDSQLDTEFKTFSKNLIPEKPTEENSVQLFFKSAEKLVSQSNLSDVEIIELQIEILTLIKNKICANK